MLREARRAAHAPAAAASLRHGRMLQREPRIAQFAPYTRHVDAATIATRDGLLLQVLEVPGLAADAADTREQLYRKELRDLMMRGLGSSEWALMHHALRRVLEPPALATPQQTYAAELDGRYRAGLASRRLFETRQYLTLIRRPLQGSVGLLEEAGRLLKGGGRSEAAQQSRAEALRSLHDAAAVLLSSLERYGARRLEARAEHGVLVSEPAAFLSALINGRWPGRDALPCPPADLAEALPARRLIFLRERLETRGPAARDVGHVAILSIKEYPPSTAPGLLDRLLDLPHALTLAQSFALMDRTAAVARIRGVEGRMRGSRDSSALAGQLEAAADAAASGATAFGAHHLTIAVHSETPAGLDAAVAEIAAALSEAGVVGVREDIGLEAAYWAQLPGNFAFIGRKAVISSANFASFASLHGAPRAPARSRWGEPLLLLETWSGAPYSFHLHHGDLGNATVIGPSGSGKTVLLGFLVAQALRIPGLRTIVFDKDRGLELAVRALGGRYHVLKPGRPAGLNPLLLGVGPETEAFLQNWLARLVSTPTRAASDLDCAVIADAVRAAMEAAPDERRLGRMAPLFAGHEQPGPGSLAERLSRWHGAGDRAWLFDGTGDALDLEAATVTGFDLTAVLDDPDARTAALMALFQAIERSLDGRPTLIVLDEGWRLLDDPVFERQIEDWQKTVRKKNAAVVFATQSAQDAAEARIGPALIEQAPTQIFFPNLKADQRAYQQGFGLTETELELVRTLPDTSRAFLLKQGAASLVVRLDLAGMTRDLAVLSGRTSSLKAFDRLLAQDGAAEPDRLFERLFAELNL